MTARKPATKPRPKPEDDHVYAALVAELGIDPAVLLTEIAADLAQPFVFGSSK